MAVDELLVEELLLDERPKLMKHHGR